MRVFSIQSDNTFTEFARTVFEAEHEEAVLENWLESNPDAILENDRVLILGRQVFTNLGGFIDLLGVDREGAVVVVELKRDRVPRDTVAQCLEYASFAERLDTDQIEEILRQYMNDESLDLAEYHKAYFELGASEAVAFNKDQRIVIVGQRVTPELRQIATFLCSKGLRVTCVEFTFFQSDDGGGRLLSQEAVVGKESEKPIRAASSSQPVVTEKAFLASLDDNGRNVFSRLLQFAKQKSMPIHWGTRGLSLNVEATGTHVAVYFGYPPNSVYKQSLHTALHSPGGVEKKTAVPEQTIHALWEQAEATGLFVPAGRDLKCQVTRKLIDAEVDSLLAWYEAVEQAIRQYGMKK